MKTLIKPETTILREKKPFIAKDEFFESEDLFTSSKHRIEVNFKKSEVIADIDVYGNHYVTKLKSNYYRAIEGSTIHLSDFEVIINFRSYDSMITHIAKKKEGHDKLREFLKEISKHHRFIDDKNDQKWGETYFIDSEKIDLAVEIKKEEIKRDEFLESLENGTLPKSLKPRFNHIDKNCLKNLVLKFPYVNPKTMDNFFRLTKENQKIYLSLFDRFEFCGDEESSFSLPNHLSDKIDHESISGLESKGIVFTQNELYLKIKKTEVFKEIGD